MAPSVQQLPEETPGVSIGKLDALTVKDTPKGAPKEAPKEAVKVKRQIDLEGGKTDAKV
jgi:taurine dioxygenase/sulfonate dioxygenase